MKKKIKEEYKGLVITFFAPGIGNVTFDPSKAQAKDYDNFARIGLDYIFEEDVVTKKEHICDENCEHNKEKTLEDFKKEVEDYSEKKPAKKGRKSMKSKLEEGEI